MGFDTLSTDVQQSPSAFLDLGVSVDHLYPEVGTDGTWIEIKFIHGTSFTGDSIVQFNCQNSHLPPIHLEPTSWGHQRLGLSFPELTGGLKVAVFAVTINEIAHSPLGFVWVEPSMFAALENVSPRCSQHSSMDEGIDEDSMAFFLFLRRSLALLTVLSPQARRYPNSPKPREMPWFTITIFWPRMLNCMTWKVSIPFSFEPGLFLPLLSVILDFAL